MSSRSPLGSRRSGLIIFVTAFFLIGLSALIVSSQEMVQPDGRINQVHHFGGDALYCVDQNSVATNDYAEMGSGGFRLLDSHGTVLLFVPAADIAAAVAEAKSTGTGVLVAEGDGTYGPVSIWTYVSLTGDDYFVFTGYDEYVKPNSLTFKFCQPVGPDEPEPTTGTEPTTVPEPEETPVLTEEPGNDTLT